MRKKMNHLMLTVFMISLLILCGMFLGSTTAFAQTTGTADGTYDFASSGVPDSAGAGFTALGDKFKAENGKFLYTYSQESGGITAIIPSATDQILNYNLFLYAEGGSVCKTFTFQDLSLISRGGNLTFQNFRLILRNCNGDLLREYNIGDSVAGIPNNSVVKLSDVVGHELWNVRGVSSIQMVFTLLDNGAVTAPCLLQLENITIADVSNEANTAPYAGNVTYNYTYGETTYGNTLTGSYAYGDDEGDLEGTSTYQWYRSDSQDGDNKASIPGATSLSYTLQEADMWKWISFEVTPVAQHGVSPGDPAESWPQIIYGPAITVEFDPMGGSVTPATQTKRNGFSYNRDANGQDESLPTPAFENGFRFDGWFTGASGTGDHVTNDTKVSAVANQRLYAFWTWETYTVTYDANNATGGNVPADTGTYHYGDNVVIKDFDASNPLYRTGYTRIDGWNTQSDGKGTDYTPWQGLETHGNMHLYAKWVPNTYTVTYDAQGGTVSPASQTKLFDSNYGKGPDGAATAPIPQPANTGYTFKGWYTGTNGTGSKITDNNKVNIASNHTLYAYWEANIYTVTLDPTGGVVYPESLQRRYGYTYLYALDGHTEGLPDAHRGGYQFIGWWTQSNGGNEVTQETVLTTASDHTLYAHWQAKNYTVTFDPEGGGVPVPNQTKLFAAPYGTGMDGVSDEDLPIPTKDGYIFAGWWTGDNGTDTRVTEETSVSTASHHTLYAKWLYTLSPLPNQTMDNLTFGYTAGAQETKTVAITRTTNDEIQNLSVWLSGADAGRFVVTQPQPGTLNSASPSATFTVRAKDGLPIGTFTATVVVSAYNTADCTFTVTQKVNPHASVGRMVSVVVYDGEQVVSGASVTINGIVMLTGADGKAVFGLGSGTYAYRTSKAGYTDTQGEFAVDGSAKPACLFLTKQGQILLPDTNGGTGLILIGGSGGYSPGLTFSVDALQPGAGDISAIKVLNSNYEVVSMFDINLLMSNHKIQPDSPITIGIPLPAGMDGKTFKVVRENDDGTLTEFNTVVVGDMLFFTTDHLSRYAVVSVNDPQPVPTNNPDPQPVPTNNPAAGGNPRTGDSFPVLPWILLMAVSLVGIILAVKLKKHIQ